MITIEKDVNVEIELTKTRTIAQIKARQKDINAKIKSQEELVAKTTLPDIAKVAVYTEIDKCRQEIDELNEELTELEEKEIRSARKELISLIQQDHLYYIAIDAKYLFVKNLSTDDTQVNLIEWYVDWKKVLGMLARHSSTPEKFDKLNELDVRNCFIKSKKSYLSRTSSFNEIKWDKKNVLNTIFIQKQFWAPITNGDQYCSLFDDLLYSLGGGKQENIDHIEKWVAFKYLYPEKVTTTPGLNITGRPGGNGKGLFKTILTSIFNPIGVGAIRGKSLTGGFNKQLEGKVIAVLDDEKKDGFPQEELKQSSGNTEQVIEPKGIDAYSVDLTHNYVILDNTGLVRLYGGGSSGEDRRWSIIDTEHTLLDVLQNKHQLNLEQAKDLAEQMAKIFANRIEVGKWLAHLIKKHQIENMTVLLALHGQDYLKRLESQKDQYVDVFDTILPIFISQKCIPFKFLEEIVETQIGKKSPKTIKDKFNDFLSRNGIKEVHYKKERVYLEWKGETLGETVHVATFMLSDGDKHSFDYSLVSNEVYTKNKSKITRETLAISDESDEKTCKIAGAKKTSTPSTPSTPTAVDSHKQGVCEDFDFLKSSTPTSTPQHESSTPVEHINWEPKVNPPKVSVQEMLKKLKDKANE